MMFLHVALHLDISIFCKYTSNKLITINIVRVVSCSLLTTVWRLLICCIHKYIVEVYLFIFGHFKHIVLYLRSFVMPCPVKFSSFLASDVRLYFCLQDNAISMRSTLFLLMANILNGTTHLSVDIQLMAFRFLELVVLNFPSSFSSYAEQVSELLSQLVYWMMRHFYCSEKIILLGDVYSLLLLLN